MDLILGAPSVMYIVGMAGTESPRFSTFFHRWASGLSVLFAWTVKRISAELSSAPQTFALKKKPRETRWAMAGEAKGEEEDIHKHLLNGTHLRNKKNNIFARW